MEERLDQVVSPSTPAGAAEERMLRGDLMQEIVARAQRGERGVMISKPETVAFCSNVPAGPECRFSGFWSGGTPAGVAPSCRARARLSRARVPRAT